MRKTLTGQEKSWVIYNNIIILLCGFVTHSFFFFFFTDNFPPNISGNSVFRVNVNQESTYFLSVTDPDDTFTLIIEGGNPNNSTLVKIEEGEYMFVLNLQMTFEPLRLVFVANDSRGGVATFEPTLEICACSNLGTCIRDGLISSNSTIIMSCQCTEGMHGQNWREYI